MKRESKITVGNHRNNSRIWLQGKWLVKFGFVRGKAWAVEYQGEKVIVTTSTQGRVISGKGETPVLDMNSSELTKVLPQGTSVKLTATMGRIILEKSAAVAALVSLAA